MGLNHTRYSIITFPGAFFVALVILVPMVVNPSQIVWAQAQTQQHSEHLKYDAPSQKQVSVPDVAQ